VAAEYAKGHATEIGAIGALGVAEQALGGVLGRLLATVEAYPDLKADQNMRELSEELASTENRVGFARQAFNDAALDYNNAAQQFPTNIIAGVFNFKEAGMLKSTESEEERKTLRVQF